MLFRSTARFIRPLALICALLAAAGGSVALAQDATPEAGDASGATATGGQLAEIGDEVSYLDEDGDEFGTVTVVEMINPFEDFDESFTPDEGARYIAFEVSGRSTGDEFELDPSDFGLQTADGFFYSYDSVSRPDDATPADLESTEIEEGDATSGMIFFVIPEDAEPSRLLWQPESGRLLLVAELGAES